MKWYLVNERKPDVKELGDGNVCKVNVLFNDGSKGKLLYGTSGAPGEGVGWFYTGKLKIVRWAKI